MKNIRIYSPKKYEGQDYKKVKENIYETIVVPQESDNCLSLKGVNDGKLVKMLLGMDGWMEDNRRDDLSYITYEGKTYFKDDDDDVYEEMKPEAETVYVTSIVFEQEPEYDENEPSDPYVSQYPLEDILDEFDCYCYDEYTKENEEDPVNSYIEFAGDTIEDVEKLLTIVGKHVYNVEDGDYVKLVIE